MTSIGGALIGYFLWWFNAASEELEELFGSDVYDITTGSLTHEIVDNLGRILAEIFEQQGNTTVSKNAIN